MLSFIIIYNIVLHARRAHRFFSDVVCCYACKDMWYIYIYIGYIYIYIYINIERSILKNKKEFHFVFIYGLSII